MSVYHQFQQCLGFIVITKNIGDEKSVQL